MPKNAIQRMLVCAVYRLRHLTIRPAARKGYGSNTWPLRAKDIIRNANSFLRVKLEENCELRIKNRYDNLSKDN